MTHANAFGQQLTASRRHAELTRMAERSDFVPRYVERFNAAGDCASAIYLGHQRVLARGTTFPTLRAPSGRASQFGPLLANVSRIDLTRATTEQQELWRDI